MRLLSILLLLIMLTGCAADTPAQTTAPEKAQEQEVSAMNITVADTRPSCLAIESGRCFYGEDEQGNFCRILWAETDALAEGIAVRVEYRDWKTLEYPNGYPDGGYTPQYEVTAISVTPQSASPDAVRSAADAMLARRCHVTDLSGFVISTVTDERGRSFVEYGIPGGFYLVAVSAEGTAEYVFDGMEKYAEYLPLATPQAIRQADEKLSAQAPSGSYYFSVNDEGYLCLNAEVIVHFKPAPPCGRKRTGDERLRHRPRASILFRTHLPEALNIASPTQVGDVPFYCKLSFSELSATGAIRPPLTRGPRCFF